MVVAVATGSSCTGGEALASAYCLAGADCASPVGWPEIALCAAGSSFKGS